MTRTYETILGIKSFGWLNIDHDYSFNAQDNYQEVSRELSKINWLLNLQR